MSQNCPGKSEKRAETEQKQSRNGAETGIPACHLVISRPESEECVEGDEMTVLSRNGRKAVPARLVLSDLSRNVEKRDRNGEKRSRNDGS